MSMNWSDLIKTAEEGGGFDAIPGGDYLAVVHDAVGMNATTGKPMVKATFRITEGPYSGRLVWNNFVLTQDNPNALKWFFRHMAAFGLDRSFFANNPSMEAVANAIKNKTVIITVTADREYAGTMQNDVKSVRAAAIPGTSAPAPAPVPTPSEEPTPAPAASNGGNPPAVPF